MVAPERYRDLLEPRAYDTLRPIGGNALRGAVSTNFHDAHGERQLIITPFSTNSLTTNDFGWYHAESWDDDDREFFLANRQTLVANFYRLPPHSRRRDESPASASRWVLRRGDLRITSVEAHLFPGHFKQLEILVGPYATTLDREEILFLVSGLLIVSACDRAMVVPSPGTEIPGLTSPQSRLTFSPGAEVRRTTAHSIDPAQWWETETGSRHFETLRYLQTRRERQRSMAAFKKKPRRRRGFLSRFWR